MHPLLVSCWTCLIGKAISDHGIEAATTCLHDDNKDTKKEFEKNLSTWGADLPLSMSLLLKACGYPKLMKDRQV